ncbi:MAG: hypothetical protein HY701_04660 [Gemmatimonadetes bacterium]|nr:hypothetical protein [Gemmatimonadota bacterium]
MAPTTMTLAALGDTVRFSAQVKDQKGLPLATAVIRWSTSAADVATIDSVSGLATAVGPGSASITARAADATGTAQILVQQRLTALTKLAGDEQIKTASTQLTDSLAVKVTDPRGNGIRGVAVEWKVTAGGGAVSPASSTTDQTGRAVTRWTLGPATTAQYATATVSGLSEVKFLAIGTHPGPGLLEGSYQFTGPLPAIEPRMLTVDGQTLQDTLYAGQVLVFFDPLTAASSASSVITAAGGSVLARVPNGGYYLAGVAPRAEEAFMTSMRSKTGVRTVVPHGVGSFMGVTVLDNCAGAHGQGVSGAITEAGAKVDACKQVTTSGNRPIESLVVDEIYAAAAKGGTIMLNLSFNGGPSLIDYESQSTIEKWVSHYSWKRWMRPILETVASLPEATRRDMVLTVSAGNGNMPIKPLLDDLRTDAKLANVLKKNVLLVAATEEAYPLSNHASDDPDVAVFGLAKCPNGIVGTSCSAPLALGAIESVGAIYDLGGANALLAAKTAIATNANHVLDVKELVTKAEQLRDALKTDGAAALNVTGISIPTKGATTIAVITPAMANVTVSYTVSGTDGYFLSGTKRTDAAGRVTFAIEPGAPNVVDTISATAVLAGITARTTHKW